MHTRLQSFAPHVAPAELEIFFEKISNIPTRHFCKFCFVKSKVDPCFAVLCANSLPGMRNRNIVQVLITLFNYF